jgi:hypothetical protein
MDVLGRFQSRMRAISAALDRNSPRRRLSCPDALEVAMHDT